MATSETFDALIQGHESGGAFVDVPFDVEAVFGKKRVKVKVWYDDVLYHGSMVRYGRPSHMLIIRKDIQARIGKGPGDSVNIVVEEDTEPRVIEVPADFQTLLDAHPEQKTFFEGLSYTHKKEYVQWIEGAKRQETRERRMHKAIEMMANGQRGR